MVALFSLLVLDALRRSVTGYRDLTAAADHLRAARPTLEPLLRFDLAAWPDTDEIATAREDLSEASRLLERADRRFGYLPVVANAFAWLPRWGPSLANADDALTTARRITDRTNRIGDRLNLLLAGDERLTDRIYQTFVTDSADLTSDLQSLADLTPEVRRLASVEWRAPFDTVSTSLDLVVDDLGQIEDAAGIAIDLRDGLPTLLGYDEPRTILLLGQNDHEVRPTGGFIGTAGVITVDQGRITSRTFGASYDMDPPPGAPRRDPPSDLSSALGIGEWYLRDANWSPDFREAGATALAFLAADQGIEVDAVMAVDSHFVALLLGALGPLTIEGYPVLLTGDNWFVQAENAIYASEFGDTAAPRDIGGSTTNLVANPSFGASAAGWAPVGGATVEWRDADTALGEAALRVTTAGVLGDGVRYAGNGNADAGQAYTASLDLRAATAASIGGDLQMLVEAAGGEYEQAVTTVRLTEEWQRFTLTYTWERPQHTAWSITIRDAIGVAVDFELDRVQVEEGNEATAFSEADSGLSPEQAASRSQARQAYLSPVLDELIGRAESAEGDAVPLLAAALARASTGRHLQLYSPHPEVQRVATRIGVDGRLEAPQGGDLLAVIDANVSYDKIQPAISRSILYVSGEGGLIDVVIRWRNDLPTFDGERYARLGEGGAVWDAEAFRLNSAPGVFANYVRVYVPMGAVLVSASGFETGPVYLAAGDLATIGGRVVVLPGKEVTARVTYQLPDRPAQLRIWKQGGFDSTTARVLVNLDGQQFTAFDGPVTQDVLLDLAQPRGSDGAPTTGVR